MATSNVSSKITRPDGTALSGVTVFAYLNPRPCFRASDGTELPGAVRTTTAADGTYTLTLERTADITPANTFYTVLEDIPTTDGGQRTYTIQVGAVNQTLLASLVSVPPAFPTPDAYLTQAAADARYVASPGSFAVVGNISQIDDGDAASAGALSTYARGDHQHAFTNGYTICTSGTRPSSPSTGRTIFETDTLKVYAWSGSAWVLRDQIGQWDSWTPSFTQSNPNMTGTTNYARFIKEGRKITATCQRNFTTGTLGVANNPIFIPNASLPADPAFTTAEVLSVGNAYWVLAGLQYHTDIVLLGNGSAGGTQVRFLRSDVVISNYLGIDPNAAVANGDKVSMTFVYEAIS